ncbi:hypothetical protein T02_5734 [Trichinella nativa]|uniref:Uncharacterized protein n=1 Tax=Trichinella nativa TaxID=6335 RepID=A0A0V1LDC5_9BILA|nr:hypothetical protein T02_5734 [Trichinella nativa]
MHPLEDELRITFSHAYATVSNGAQVEIGRLQNDDDVSK